jgi:hypothetical protein
MNVHLARLSGNTRAGFPTKVHNFFMAIHCLSPKASEMVTANLQGVFKRHIQRVSAKCCGPPVIHLTDKEIVLAVEKQIKMVHGRSGNKSLHVEMSLGVNVTVISRAFQYLAFNEFKEMLKSGCTVEQIGIHALKIMELMQLGRIEKGLESMDLNIKSLTARWYGCKTKKA